MAASRGTSLNLSPFPLLLSPLSLLPPSSCRHLILIVFALGRALLGSLLSVITFLSEALEKHFRTRGLAWLRPGRKNYEWIVHWSRLWSGHARATLRGHRIWLPACPRSVRIQDLLLFLGRMQRNSSSLPSGPLSARLRAETGSKTLDVANEVFSTVKSTNEVL